MKKILNKYLPVAYGTYFNSLVYFAPEKVAKNAFEVFCTVRKGKVLPAQAPFLDIAKDKLHKVADLQIQAYRWIGNGPTVLLVHGWESNAWRWHKLIAKLQQADFNIIAFDAPAHGYSSGKVLNVPIYAKVLEHMTHHYRPQHLVGHSVGGMTAIFHEYHHPGSEIDKIVTIGSPSEFHEIMAQYQAILGLNGKVMRAIDTYLFSRFGFHIREVSSSCYVKTNTKKGLLFHDRSDKIAPYHASESVHAAWKGSRLVSTDGLGHSMHQDEVNDELVAFLRE